MDRVGLPAARPLEAVQLGKEPCPGARLALGPRRKPGHGLNERGTVHGPIIAQSPSGRHRSRAPASVEPAGPVAVARKGQP